MITMNSNFDAPKATSPAFKGFLQIKSVNKLKNGAREAIDTFVLNTDNIAEMTPLKNVGNCGFGAKIKTKLDEIIEIPAFRESDGFEIKFDNILNKLIESVAKGYSMIHW